MNRLKRFVKMTWIFYPLVLAVLMYLLLPFFPDFTEYVVSRVLFKIVTVPLGFVTSLLPFSFTELLVITALPLVVTAVVLFVMRMKKTDSKKRTAIKAARCVAGFLSFAALMYMLCHGANYYRRTASELMELDTSPKSAEQLTELCMYLGEKAAQARSEITDSSAEYVFSEDMFTELSRAGNGYDKLVAEHPWLWTSVWRQKPVQLSYLWSYTGIVGMYFPFFAECNVNIEQPDYAIPFTAAHESAHSRGVAFEDECNFYAFLSCINSDYPEYRYSGYLNGFIFCANALHDYDKELWEQAWSVVTDGMRADIVADNDYIDRFANTVIDGPGDLDINPWEAAGDINDAFIKSQGVTDGALSYDRVTELILAYYYTEK